MAQKSGIFCFFYSKSTSLSSEDSLDDELDYDLVTTLCFLI